MKKNIFRVAALFLALVLPSVAFASSCFWVPLVVSGAVSGTAGVCRLTITPITGSGLLAGDTVIVAGVAGATGCNVTAAISTVVDSTHIELTGTTFGGAYTSGGTVAGGHWGTGNTSNWASATGGTVGTCAATGGVPKQAADTATFDGSSGGGTVTVDSTINGVTLTQITMGAFTGTLDFSVNNPSITLTSLFSNNGSALRRLNLGSGTFTLAGLTGNVWDFGTTTNLTFNAGTSVILISPSGSPTGTRTFNTTNITYATMTVASFANTQATESPFSVTQGTFGTLNVNGPSIFSLTSTTITVTNMNFLGTSAAPISVSGGGGSHSAIVATTVSAAWTTFAGLAFSGGTFTASNSFNCGSVSGITINPPSGGGGGAPPMIGGT